MNHVVDVRVTALPAAYRPLGALRFGLATAVMAQHFQYLLPADQRALLSHMGLGIVAVAIFFVVSGFVVAEANTVFYRNRPAAFLANRLLRIVPPYLAATLLSAAVHTALWQSGRLVLWDYTLNTSPLTPGLLLGGLLGVLPGFHTRYIGQDFEFIPFAWSLRVEMAFYLAATCVLLLARWWRHAVAVSMVLALAACLALLPGAGPSLLSDLPMFLLGAALFSFLSRRDSVHALLAAAGCAAAALGFASLGQHGAPNLAAQFMVLAALLALFIRLASVPAGPRWRTLDRALGDLSYPLYLNHYIVGIAIFDLWPGRGCITYIVGMLVAVALATIMAKTTDAPLLGLRTRLRGASV
jgi:peptidoglycan/LPS O-acetylase OafA/YrhL